MRSFLSTFVFVAVCAYSARADTPASPANSQGATQPTIVTMKCSQAFMPISEADLAAMNSTDPTQPPAGNYSTVPTEAACKAFDDPTGGFCNPKSCVGYPVGEQCNEVIITGANSTSLSDTTVARVSCEVNYFKPAPNDKDQRVLCTAQDQKIYSCKGHCVGEATCTECVSMSDPALANL